MSVSSRFLPPDPIYNTEDDVEKEKYGCGMFATQEDWHDFLFSLVPITIVSILAVLVIYVK